VIFDLCILMVATSQQKSPKPASAYSEVDRSETDKLTGCVLVGLMLCAGRAPVLNRPQERPAGLELTGLVNSQGY